MTDQAGDSSGGNILRLIAGERNLPCAIDAEAAILSASMLDADSLREAMRLLRPAHFFGEAHKRIYEAALAVWDRGVTVDIVSIAERLRDTGRLEQVGGMTYLTQVIDAAPAVGARLVGPYAKLVFDTWRRRTLIATCQRIAAEAALEVPDTDRFVAASVQEVVALEASAPRELKSVEDGMDDLIDRAMRRMDGTEAPIPLPWGSILAHFGSGLWPGVHYLCSSTGIGKTAAALQIATNAAKRGVPVLYVGLESEQFEFTSRVLGEEAGVPWSRIFTGQASVEAFQRFAAAREAPALRGLPLFPVYGRPQGWPVSELARLGEELRRRYPEENGPGSRPVLLVLDFLQIVGAEETKGRPAETRERIGRAAYFMRDLASRLRVAVLVISSIARDKYTVLADAEKLLSYSVDEATGRPVNRRIRNPDALVGLGKESGEIEYSGDSVSVIFRTGEDDGLGCDVAFATVKGRATGSTWSPFRFTGFRYEEAADGGAGFVARQQAAAEKREQAKVIREQVKQAKDQLKVTETLRDAVAVVAYLQDQPGASVARTRAVTVSDSSKRWKAVVDLLGQGMIMTRTPGRSSNLRIEPQSLPADVVTLIAGPMSERPPEPDSDAGRVIPEADDGEAGEGDGLGGGERQGGLFGDA